MCFFVVAEVYGQDVVTQYPPEITDFEGQNVTLNCSYSTINAAFWYRQYPDGAPQYLFRIYSSGKKGRITATMNYREKGSNLSITGAEVTDAATYLCAVEIGRTQTPSDQSAIPLLFNTVTAQH
uniref:Ig-like domain-containing protein n=1 Tax=Callorhinchus milii TaxID=7868 RepID=A0A4W3H4Z3_CALMI